MTTYEKAKEIENKIVELNTLINNYRYSKTKRQAWMRSRAAFKANLTRLEKKLEAEAVFEIETPATPTEKAVISIGLVDEDKDENVVIKSSVTASQLGWTPPVIKKTSGFKKSEYYEVMAVHSHTNFTS